MSRRYEKTKVDLYINHIQERRGVILTCLQQQSLRDFQFDKEEFINLLRTSQKLQKTFYNRTIHVNLHTDGLVGHVSADLPILQDGIIKECYQIGLDPETLSFKVIFKTPGAIFEQRNREDFQNALQKVPIQITEEQYLKAAQKLAKYQENPPKYNVGGIFGGINCIYFMDKFLKEIGIVDGLQNKFDFSRLKEQNWKAIKLQAHGLFDEFKLEQAKIEIFGSNLSAEAEVMLLDRATQEIASQTHAIKELQIQSNVNSFCNPQNLATSTSQHNLPGSTGEDMATASLEMIFDQAFQNEGLSPYLQEKYGVTKGTNPTNTSSNPYQIGSMQFFGSGVMSTTVSNQPKEQLQPNVPTISNDITQKPEGEISAPVANETVLCQNEHQEALPLPKPPKIDKGFGNFVLDVHALSDKSVFVGASLINNPTGINISSGFVIDENLILFCINKFGLLLGKKMKSGKIKLHGEKFYYTVESTGKGIPERWSGCEMRITVRQVVTPGGKGENGPTKTVWFTLEEPGLEKPINRSIIRSAISEALAPLMNQTFNKHYDHYYSSLNRALANNDYAEARRLRQEFFGKYSDMSHLSQVSTDHKNQINYHDQFYQVRTASLERLQQLKNAEEFAPHLEHINARLDFSIHEKLTDAISSGDLTYASELCSQINNPDQQQKWRTYLDNREHQSKISALLSTASNSLQYASSAEEFSKSEALFSEILKEELSCREAQEGLSKSLLGQKEYQKLSEYIQSKFLQHDSEDTFGLMMEGIAQLGLGNIQVGQDSLKKILAKDSSNEGTRRILQNSYNHEIARAAEEYNENFEERIEQLEPKVRMCAHGAKEDLEAEIDQLQTYLQKLDKNITEKEKWMSEEKTSDRNFLEEENTVIEEGNAVAEEIKMSEEDVLEEQKKVRDSVSKVLQYREQEHLLANPRHIESWMKTGQMVTDALFLAINLSIKKCWVDEGNQLTEEGKRLRKQIQYLQTSISSGFQLGTHYCTQQIEAILKTEIEFMPDQALSGVRYVLLVLQTLRGIIGSVTIDPSAPTQCFDDYILPLIQLFLSLGFILSKPTNLMAGALSFSPEILLNIPEVRGALIKPHPRESLASMRFLLGRMLEQDSFISSIVRGAGYTTYFGDTILQWLEWFSAIGSSQAAFFTNLLPPLRVAYLVLRIAQLLCWTIPITYYNNEEKWVLYHEEWAEELIQVAKKNRQDGKNITASQIFRDIKETLAARKTLSANSHKLFIKAMLLEHIAAQDYITKELTQDGNSFFESVALYTNETAAGLRALMLRYMGEHRDFFAAQTNDNFDHYLQELASPNREVSQLGIHALSCALGRPIVDINRHFYFDKMPAGDVISSRDPIFVNYQASFNGPERNIEGNEYAVVDVSADGNCFYYALISSMLIPVLDHLGIYDARFRAVFGNDVSNEDYLALRNQLKNDYDRSPRFFLINPLLKRMITEFLRPRIANYLQDNSDEFVNFEDEKTTLNKIILEVLSPIGWVNNIVIQAVRGMLNAHRIHIYQENEDGRLREINLYNDGVQYHPSESSTRVQLYFTNVRSVAGVKNHYKYFIDKTILQKQCVSCCSSYNGFIVPERYVLVRHQDKIMRSFEQSISESQASDNDIQRIESMMSQLPPEVQARLQAAARGDAQESMDAPGSRDTGHMPRPDLFHENRHANKLRKRRNTQAKNDPMSNDFNFKNV